MWAVCVMLVLVHVVDVSAGQGIPFARQYRSSKTCSSRQCPGDQVPTCSLETFQLNGTTMPEGLAFQPGPDSSGTSLLVSDVFMKVDRFGPWGLGDWCYPGICVNFRLSSEPGVDLSGLRGVAVTVTNLNQPSVLTHTFVFNFSSSPLDDANRGATLDACLGHVYTGKDGAGQPIAGVFMFNVSVAQLPDWRVVDEGIIASFQLEDPCQDLTFDRSNFIVGVSAEGSAARLQLAKIDATRYPNTSYGVVLQKYDHPEGPGFNAVRECSLDEGEHSITFVSLEVGRYKVQVSGYYGGAPGACPRACRNEVTSQCESPCFSLGSSDFFIAPPPTTTTTPTTPTMMSSATSPSVTYSATSPSNTTPQVPSPQVSPPDSAGLSSWQVVLMVVAGLVLVVLALVCGVCYSRFKARDSSFSLTGNPPESNQNGRPDFANRDFEGQTDLHARYGGQTNGYPGTDNQRHEMGNGHPGLNNGRAHGISENGGFDGQTDFCAGYVGQMNGHPGTDIPIRVMGNGYSGLNNGYPNGTNGPAIGHDRSDGLHNGHIRPSNSGPAPSPPAPLPANHPNYQPDSHTSVGANSGSDVPRGVQSREESGLGSAESSSSSERRDVEGTRVRTVSDDSGVARSEGPPRPPPSELSECTTAPGYSAMLRNEGGYRRWDHRRYEERLGTRPQCIQPPEYPASSTAQVTTSDYLEMLRQTGPHRWDQGERQGGRYSSVPGTDAGEPAYIPRFVEEMEDVG